MTARVAVVGGGIAGLAAAWEASRQGHEVVVFEAQAAAGGKILTSELGGVAVDAGPDAFLARVPDAIELCEEVGLGDELVKPVTSSASILAEGRLHRIPSRQLLGVPFDADELAASGLVSADAVARVRSERDVPGEPLVADTTVGALVRRRLGDEVLERLTGALIGGINAGDPDATSLAAATPRLAEAARLNGSLLAGIDELLARPSEPSAPAFLTPEGGLGSLVDRLVEILGSSVRTGRTVERIDLEDRWRVDGEAFTHVVLATPAPVSARLLRHVDPDVASALAAIEHASVAIVTTFFSRGSVTHPLDGSGFLVPAGEGRLITACSFASSKWLHLNDHGRVILRTSVGRIGDDRAGSLADDALVAGIVGDLTPVLGLSAPPTEVRISRWPRSLPQYRPGHLELIDGIDDQLGTSAPGLSLAGAPCRGVGLPACIASGRRAIRESVGS